MPLWTRWGFAVAILVLIVAPPIVLYRAQYTNAKRFREVSPGRVYRSGQMTASGFRENIERYKIKTVINLQHENPDPALREQWLGKPVTTESELCKELGVRYVLLTPDILPEPNDVTKEPPAVTEFIKLLDDETVYPVLLHCKAGLHRTGRLTAIYRMEFENWDPGAALRELRANGYGFLNSSEADNFIVQFVQNYQPRSKAKGAARGVQP